jgi:GTPase Era involved in 16S rRNA processing
MELPHSHYPEPRENISLPTVDAAGELSFVRDLLSRNAFHPDEQKRLENYVRHVEKRNTDHNLYLAVLGEFNSGKSTFINALLRRKLLKAAPKATTAAATMIHHGSSFSITIQFTDGTYASGSESGFIELANTIKGRSSQEHSYATLQDILHIVTADPAVTRLVSEVEITLPAETLRDGTYVIDTPGIGAADDATVHHAAIIEGVTAELADVAVVLIPSESAMSRTLLNFLGGSARRFLHRCIFVVTKLDQIEDSDRESLMTFINNKLQGMVRRKPLILQSSAAAMLTNRMTADSERWREEFLSLEATLHHELSRNRGVIIAEHLTNLLQALLTGLQDAISTKKVALDRERAVLEQNSVVALEGVLTHLFERCKTEIEQEVQNCKLHVVEYTEYFGQRAATTVNGLLQVANRRTLIQIVEVNIPAAIAAHQRDYDHACELLFGRLRSKCEQVQQLFVQQFEESYRNLRALGIRLEVSQFAAVSDSLGRGHFSLAVGFLNTSRKARERMGRGVGVGLGVLTAPFAGIAGAVIGGIIGCSGDHPSVGSWFMGLLLGGMLGFVTSIIAGGFAGGNVGAQMGNFDDRRAEVHRILMPEVQEHCAKSKAGWLQRFDYARDNALGLLSKSVVAHTTEYEGAVKQMQEGHSRRKLTLSIESKQAEADSAALLIRCQKLDETRDILLNL